MNKFVERAFELEDRQRGYVVYRGTKPKYHKQPRAESVLAALLTALVLMALIYVAYGLLYILLPAGGL